MKKLYSLRLITLNGKPYLEGELENGKDVILQRVVFFNKHSGLLYTAKRGYIVMSFLDGSEYQVNEFINEQLEEIWV
jgi:hypothetical protein